MTTIKNEKSIFLMFFIIMILYTLTGTTTNKEIQAFYKSSDKEEYTNFRYDLLTTIVYAKVDINADGSLIPSKDYDPSFLISYAHNKKVKVVLMFQGEDGISKDTMLENQTIRSIAINNLINEIKKYNFDGIDIDLENINITNSINGEPNKQLMTDFVTTLSDKFREIDANYRISIDVGMYIDQTFDLVVLQNKVDYIMIMGYDIYGSRSYNAGPNSPIRLDDGQGIYDIIKHYKNLVDRKKLLLGVPWYGYEFATVDDSRLAPVNGDIKDVSYKYYIDIVNKYNRKWDPIWQTPWYAYQDNNTSQWYQIHGDDIQSLGIKYDLIKSENLAGIGIWTINYGSYRPELWQLIEYKFVRANIKNNRGDFSFVNNFWDFS